MSKKSLLLLMILICSVTALAASFRPASRSGSASDKTLVTWVQPVEKEQKGEKEYKGGSVLTVQSGEQYDAIVLDKDNSWRICSNDSRRQTKKGYPQEIKKGVFVQIAAVYKDSTISLYRNGKLLEKVDAPNTQLLKDDTYVLIGQRYFAERGVAGGYFVGKVDDARIYDFAMTEQQLKQIKPNSIVIGPKPYAWWDFEADTANENMGRYKYSAACIYSIARDGVLTINLRGYMTASNIPETITPGIKKDVPDTWLTYHLAHRGSGHPSPADPTVGFYYKGLYHMHYVCQNRWGHAFAHVVSNDMVHWSWQPTVLTRPYLDHQAYSGTGFLTKKGQPAVVYQGRDSGYNFVTFAQDDELNKWSKPKPIIPRDEYGVKVLPHPWDPDAWIMDGKYYVMFGGIGKKDAFLVTSDDLNKFEYKGRFFHEDTPWKEFGHSLEPDETYQDVSCANMVEMGGRWVLMCISHDLGFRYYIGDFVDGKYLPEKHVLMNWDERMLFAAESLLTDDGRRVVWIWSSTASGKNGMQRAIMTLPREMDLTADGIMITKPIDELKILRNNQVNYSTINASANKAFVLNETEGDAVEITADFTNTISSEYGIKLFTDRNGKGGFKIAYLPDENCLQLGDTKPELELKKGQSLKLRVFIDKDLIEVFANDIQATLYLVNEDEKAGDNIAIYTDNASVEANVNSWNMKSIYK